jgi:hypothetical protein
VRNLRLLDRYRCTGPAIVKYFGGIGDHETGVFEVPSKIDKAPMRVIASNGLEWDHVSVSRRNRTPNWAEMAQIKDLFFHDDETVMQLRVPASDHINDHPHCLHLWRPHKTAIPRPPSCLVGGMSRDEANAEINRLVAGGMTL